MQYHFQYRKRKFLVYCLSLSLLYSFGCNKFVGVPEPINTITAAETFGSDATAISALVAIYSNMSWGNGGYLFANCGTSIYPGLSSDELNVFGINQYQTNSILASDGTANNVFWQPAYFDIYMANGVIENLRSSSAVTLTTKKQLVGEAKWIRAFCYFYLTNIFGAVPLDTTNTWANTSLLPRADSGQIYRQVIDDLTDAKNSLTDDYSISGGERIRANTWAASALLARAYLYYKKWDSAEAQATIVINNGSLFNLIPNLDSVFLKNSSESILQLQTIDNGHYATYEGFNFIPPDLTSSPNYFLTSQLLNAFERGDQRFAHWVDSTIYNDGTTTSVYYFPYKYKTAQGSPGNINEYYTLLRYSEQFLIRAEARAERNINLPGAISDLNQLRERAKLPDLPISLTQSEVLDAIAQERRIELFAEWGHRWFDLKRTGQAVSKLSSEKGFPVTTDALLYPIPVSELKVDPNLTQNPGY